MATQSDKTKFGNPLLEKSFGKNTQEIKVLIDRITTVPKNQGVSSGKNSTK